MSTNSISGNYDYSGLKSVLEENGVESKNISGAIDEVAESNSTSASNLKSASEKLTISSSIFEEYGTGAKSDFSSGYLDTDTYDTSSLPEIYNDDDYEVTED